MSGWASFALAALIAISTVIAIFAVMRSSVSRIEVALSELTKSVNALITGAAVNAAQQSEMSRRVSEVEQTIGEHVEQIRVLRTKVHMVSGKVMEIDPKWKPYQNEDI